jgi:hypothetical protein
LRTVIERCRRARMVPYLAVLKRHRPDPFPVTPALDGYSLAIDSPSAPIPRRAASGPLPRVGGRRPRAGALLRRTPPGRPPRDPWRRGGGAVSRPDGSTRQGYAKRLSRRLASAGPDGVHGQ